MDEKMDEDEMFALMAEELQNQGYGITSVDIAEWYEPTGEGDAERVDEAARVILGRRAYEYYEFRARLAAAFEYKLGVRKEKVVGGVDVSRTIF